jgi:hypothetical protein
MAHIAPSRERVLIVGKTRMHHGVCIGGMRQSGEPVRLLPLGQIAHPLETPFTIGEVWEMDLIPRLHIEPPHVEDHEEADAVLVGRVHRLAALIRERVAPFHGPPEALFSGCLSFRPRGTAYVNTTGPLPAFSVQFWVLPFPLRLVPFGDKPQYRAMRRQPFVIAYVGLAMPVAFIPAGALVRVSLARAWAKAPDPVERTRCSLQLSGWIDETRDERAPPTPGSARS